MKSSEKAGRAEGRAEEIAARAVNKEKARSGGRTREQLYNDARKLGIQGRSKMNKSQLQKAVAGAS